MSLAAGSRLGPYEIVSPLGAGGMGEVYRGRDTRLGRTVAIKVLPERLSSSEELRQRFEREARTISQLSHPHICALYDIGEAVLPDGGPEGGASRPLMYLVMEYLEGETLAERLGRGPLALDQALRYGVEIADGLEKAHRQGIVHRDLKPGNVMLTKSGVKILDFGLAKALGPSSSVSALTALPTETPLTEKGVLLGTVQYMSPEQLEGKEADARADIFALGLVLYESVTGRKPFVGASQASLIGSILRDDPAPISRIQPVSPKALDRVVATCLAKEPEDRWQTARDVALQLEGIRRERSEPEAAVLPARHRRAAFLPWTIAAAVVALAAALLAVLIRSREVPRPRLLRSFLVPPPNTTFHVYGANVAGVAVSPDGRRVAFGTREADGSSRLWIRDVEALEPYPLPGGEGALFPFWSPDGRSIAFFAKGKLKAMEASPSAQPPRDLADVTECRGGSWGKDGTILYSRGNFTSLMRVPSGGGTPVAATQLDAWSKELAHRWPHFLPDGRRFLYEIRKAGTDLNSPLAGPHGVFLGSLDGGEKRQILAEDTSAAYVPPGYLVFRRGNNLMAVACDPQSLALRGDPRVLAENIEGFVGTGGSVFSVSRDLLVYSPFVGATPTKMVWLDRSGKELATVGPPGRYVYLGVSSDGRAAVTAQIEDLLPPDLWLFDTGVGRGIRLTRDAKAQVAPVFSVKGDRIFFSSFSTGPWDLFEMVPQSGRELKPLLETSATKIPNDVSPDGRWLLYREFSPVSRGDLKFISLTGERRPQTFLASPDDESNGDFSPDGRWVAYASDESGRREVYVASFPEPAKRFRVSAGGGSPPRWSRDGKDLFYVRSGQLLAVPVGRQGEDLTFGESRPLFALPLLALNDPGFDHLTRYDVVADGRFFALVQVGEQAATPLVLVQNWREALRNASPKDASVKD